MAAGSRFVKRPALRVEAVRLLFAPLCGQDCIETYVVWLNDPGVSRFMETRLHVQTPVRDFLSAVNARDNEHLFGISLYEGRRHMGEIRVGPFHQYYRCADIKLFVGEKDCWRRSYATEAILALRNYAFAQLDVAKLRAGMYGPNAGSAKAFAKTSYVHEGVRRAQYLFDCGRCDIVLMGLCALGMSGESAAPGQG